tara:strand:+ start:6579 stop:7316 length:738 start_codon:yes stop_codon:yes gene_type:complete
MKNIAFIPARLASSRFPNKVLADIHGKTMLQCVFDGIQNCGFDEVYITTCDNKIIDVAASFGASSILTSNKHERCLDRVAEAYSHLSQKYDSDNIYCIQGDEPMIDHDICKHFIENFNANTYDFAVSAVNIFTEKEFVDPDIVKIVWNEYNKMVYTSRSPIPHMKYFDSSKAWKIFGMFAFTPKMLTKFNELPSSMLEKIESCDTNRICGLNDLEQYVIPFISSKRFQAVDNLKNIETVRSLMTI